MRLTERKANGLYELKDRLEIYGDRLIQIVGRYEDIEEQFDIELGILVDALKQGIIYVPFIYNKDGTLERAAPLKVIGINRDRIIYECPNGLYATKLIKDYGKTWVLKEGDLLW